MDVKTARLVNRTDEEKKVALIKAKETRVAKSAARKASSLRRDFLDADFWANLAHDQGLRLPPWGEPATMSNMRMFLRRVGWNQTQFERLSGCKLEQLINKNPSWPARALAGIILEIQEEYMHISSPIRAEAQGVASGVVH